MYPARNPARRPAVSCPNGGTLRPMAPTTSHVTNPTMTAYQLVIFSGRYVLRQVKV